MAVSPSTGIRDPADEMFAWFRTMLDTQPVYLDHKGNKQLWQVFSYADVTRVLSDSATFSSNISAFTPPEPDLELFLAGNIVTMDPPQHHKQRALIGQAFTPRMVAALAPRITEVTTSLLDAVHGADRFDLVDALAYPLPFTVIAELLGVPAADQPQFRAWAQLLFDKETVDANTLAPADEKIASSMVPAMREMNKYVLSHIRSRRQRPTDDLISKLTIAEVDDERLADAQIVGFVGVLLVAGYITARALLGNVVLCFDRHPEAAAVRADRRLLPVAIEEALRVRPPFPRLSRVTTTDTEIGGHPVPAGQLVIPWLASANRDAAQFPDPDRFDIHRNITGHVAFGHGVHFCIGAMLGRLETKIALGILLDRYKEIAVDVAGPIEFHNPWEMISVKRLPVLVA